MRGGGCNSIFACEYIHEKGEEQSLPYCNKTCYVNCWLGNDCEALCGESAKIGRVCKLAGAVANLPQSRIVHSRVRWYRITDYIITGENKHMQSMSKI